MAPRRCLLETSVGVDPLARSSELLVSYQGLIRRRWPRRATGTSSKRPGPHTPKRSSRWPEPRPLMISESASDKLQLERLGFADLDALDKTIRESSRRELRGLIEALVFCALVTVMRQSGRKAVSKVADAIGIPSAVPGLNNLGYLLTGIAASGLVFSLCILILLSQKAAAD